MRGLQAYKTYCGLVNHFRESSSYDGWLYNFKVKVSEETFTKKKDIIYQFAAVEKEFPSVTQQLMFFYPAFATRGYVAPNNMRVFRGYYREFSEYMKGLEQSFPESLKELKSSVDTLKGLFDNSNLLPKIYDVAESGVMTYRDVVVLFLVVPNLNSVVSNEPFVYAKWKARIDLHKRFYSLFIDQPTLRKMIQDVVDIYSD